MHARVREQPRRVVRRVSRRSDLAPRKRKKLSRDHRFKFTDSRSRYDDTDLVHTRSYLTNRPAERAFGGLFEKRDRRCGNVEALRGARQASFVEDRDGVRDGRAEVGLSEYGRFHGVFVRTDCMPYRRRRTMRRGLRVRDDEVVYEQPRQPVLLALQFTRRLRRRVRDVRYERRPSRSGTPHHRRRVGPLYPSTSAYGTRRTGSSHDFAKQSLLRLVLVRRRNKRALQNGIVRSRNARVVRAFVHRNSEARLFVERFERRFSHSESRRQLYR